MHWIVAFIEAALSYLMQITYILVFRHRQINEYIYQHTEPSFKVGSAGVCSVLCSLHYFFSKNIN